MSDSTTEFIPRVRSGQPPFITHFFRFPQMEIAKSKDFQRQALSIIFPSRQTRAPALLQDQSGSRKPAECRLNQCLRRETAYTVGAGSVNVGVPSSSQLLSRRPTSGRLEGRQNSSSSLKKAANNSATIGNAMRNKSELDCGAAMRYPSF